LPDGTALFTERNGNLRAIQNGELIQEPLLTLGVGAGEGGLLGVTVDPDFEQNNYIYLYYTYTEFVTTSNKVVRYQVNDRTVTEDKVLINGIPGASYHDTGFLI
jgi:glucose/arabinose dehydrogenase